MQEIENDLWGNSVCIVIMGGHDIWVVMIFCVGSFLNILFKDWNTCHADGGQVGILRVLGHGVFHGKIVY